LLPPDDRLLLLLLPPDDLLPERPPLDDLLPERPPDDLLADEPPRPDDDFRAPPLLAPPLLAPPLLAPPFRAPPLLAMPPLRAAADFDADFAPPFFAAPPPVDLRVPPLLAAPPFRPAADFAADFAPPFRAPPLLAAPPFRPAADFDADLEDDFEDDPARFDPDAPPLLALFAPPLRAPPFEAPPFFAAAPVERGRRVAESPFDAVSVVVIVSPEREPPAFFRVDFEPVAMRMLLRRRCVRDTKQELGTHRYLRKGSRDSARDLRARSRIHEPLARYILGAARHRSSPSATCAAAATLQP
jgi:hypothetical protein